MTLSGAARLKPNRSAPYLSKGRLWSRVRLLPEPWPQPQDQPSIAHSTGDIPLGVRSCPLPESTRLLARSGASFRTVPPAQVPCKPHRELHSHCAEGQRGGSGEFRSQDYRRHLHRVQHRPTQGDVPGQVQPAGECIPVGFTGHRNQRPRCQPYWPAPPPPTPPRLSQLPRLSVSEPSRVTNSRPNPVAGPVRNAMAKKEKKANSLISSTGHIVNIIAVARPLPQEDHRAGPRTLIRERRIVLVLPPGIPCAAAGDIHEVGFGGRWCLSPVQPETVLALDRFTVPSDLRTVLAGFHHHAQLPIPRSVGRKETHRRQQNAFNNCDPDERSRSPNNHCRTLVE